MLDDVYVFRRPGSLVLFKVVRRGGDGSGDGGGGGDGSGGDGGGGDGGGEGRGGGDNACMQQRDDAIERMNVRRNKSMTK